MVDSFSFQNSKSLSSLMNQEQNRQAALASSNIETETKKNLYAAQVLSMGTANSNQAEYEASLNHLAQSGIDISGMPKDVESGKQLAASARLATSPIAGLLNTATKMDALQNAQANVAGEVAPGGGTSITQQVLGGMGLGPKRPVATRAGQSGPIDRVVSAKTSNPAEQSKEAIALQQALTGISGGQNADNQQISMPPRGNMTQAAYEALPEVKKANAAAETAGKAAGDLPLQASRSQEITDRLNENINKMLKLNDKVPGPVGMSPDIKAEIYKRTGVNKDAANATAQWHQIDQQQILSDYAQLVSSGQIRGNKSLFMALQQGSGVNIDQDPETRKNMLLNLKAEIQNKNISSQNVNAAMSGTGGVKQPYNSIPDQAQSGDLIIPPLDKRIPGQTKITTPKGIFVWYPQGWKQVQ